jgi:site-specific DNA-methyltransferase (adenine-specific)
MKDMTDKSVDMVLTDPPYGMRFQSNYRKQIHKKIQNDNSVEWIDEFSRQIYRVAKENTAHYIFCSFHNIDKFKMSLEKHFTFKNILIWEKNNTSMGDLNGDFAPKYEMIIFLHKGRRDIIGSRDSNIIKCAKTGNDLHPTQKPVELCAYLLSKFSKENDTVLDPFMGSGTTGVACKKLNRNFIGIELDADYFKIASDRIAKPVEVPLF